jgi:hypothetical protein
MKHALAALLVLAACGGDPRSEIDAGDDGTGDDGTGDDGAGDDGAGDDGAGDDVAEYTSGTRIRRRMGVTPDGARMFLGWRDTMRNEDCSFSLAADGVLRCIPVGYALFVNYYSDAQCTKDLPVALCSGAPARGYATKIVSGCGAAPTYSVFQITGIHSGPVYYGSGPASCAMTTPPATYTLFTVGPAIAPIMFQSMTESVE